MMYREEKVEDVTMTKPRCEDVKLPAVKNTEEGHGPRNASSHRKVQKASKHFSSPETSEGAQSCDTFT